MTAASPSITLMLKEFAAGDKSAAERDALLSPDEPPAQLLRSTARTQTGFTDHLLGNPSAAQPFYFGGMQIREQLAREHPGDLMYRRALKLAYEHYAALLADPDRANLGRPDLPLLIEELVGSSVPASPANLVLSVTGESLVMPASVTYTYNAASVTAPEPASFVLLGGGLLALGWASQKRNSWKPPAA
jgi:hypothetical protein